MTDVRFGMKDVNDLFGKAKRELTRFTEATEDQDRVDHGINLSIALHHLADWTFNYGKSLGVDVGNEGDFLSSARTSNDSVNILRKIADTSKHHTLSNKGAIRIPVDNVGSGELVLHQELFTGGPAAPVTDLPGGKVVSIRPVIDDDEIQGYKVLYKGTVVTNNGSGVFLESVCTDALEFWENAIRTLEQRKKPDWI